MTTQICMIELALESAHQSIYNDILIHLKAISIGRDTNISM